MFRSTFPNLTVCYRTLVWVTRPWSWTGTHIPRAALLMNAETLTGLLTCGCEYLLFNFYFLHTIFLSDLSRTSLGVQLYYGRLILLSS